MPTRRSKLDEPQHLVDYAARQYQRGHLHDKTPALASFLTTDKFPSTTREVSPQALEVLLGIGRSLVGQAGTYNNYNPDSSISYPTLSSLLTSPSIGYSWYTPEAGEAIKKLYPYMDEVEKSSTGRRYL